MNKVNQQISTELPDFDSPDVQKRLSPAALTMFFSMVRIWGVSDEDAQRLLGVLDIGEMLRMKNNLNHTQLHGEALMRISYLLGIFKALNVLLSEQLADRWISVPNKNITFGGQSPLHYMIAGGLAAMLTVRRLLDSRCAGN